MNTKFASITVSTDATSSSGSIIEGFNLAAVTLPLMLIKPDLLMLLTSLVSEQELSASQSDVDLFSTQIRRLLSECHEASARVERSPTSEHLATTSSELKTMYDCSSNEMPSHVDCKREQRWYSREISAGVLLLAVETTLAEKTQKDTTVRGVYIAFIPRGDISNEGISVTFEKGINFASRNTIARNLRMFNVLNPGQFKLVISVFESDDVEGLKVNLRNRTFQPWDRGTDGQLSLLQVGNCHFCNMFCSANQTSSACFTEVTNALSSYSNPGQI